MGRLKRRLRRRFSPLREWQDPPQLGHGRIDQRQIAILPAEALSEYMREQWPTIQSIARVNRTRAHVRAGKTVKTQTETAYLITSFSKPTPQKVLKLNRNHWGIEIMHRDKDVTLGEDRYTNRSDDAPRNIFTLLSAARTMLKSVAKSPTRAIEIMQDRRQYAISLITDEHKNALL